MSALFYFYYKKSAEQLRFFISIFGLSSAYLPLKALLRIRC